MYRPLTLLFIMQGAFTASCTKSYLKVNVKNNPAVIANESGNGDNGGANANVAPTISHNCAMQVNTGSNLLMPVGRHR